MAHNFKTTNIRGKNYVEVNERIKYFRTSPDYAGFSLSSSMVHFDADSCVIQATICDAQGKVIATGYAQEDRTSSNIIELLMSRTARPQRGVVPLQILVSVSTRALPRLTRYLWLLLNKRSKKQNLRRRLLQKRSRFNQTKS